MAINIQSLFQDIIETPAQRQQRMLQEGILKGRELTAGLTGLARTQAPLVSALMMNMPRQQEALRRGVGGMLGLDVRSESEKVQDALKNVDPNNPQSLLQAAQMIQGLGLGTQAAQMRQMAAEQKRQQDIDERQKRIQELQISAAEREELLAKVAEENKNQNAIRYKSLGVPDAFIQSYKVGELSASDLMKAWGENLSAKGKIKPFKFESLKGTDEETAVRYISENEDAQKLLKEIQEGTKSFWNPWSGKSKFDVQDLLDEAAVWRGLDESLTIKEAVNQALQTLPIGGARAVIASSNPEYVNEIQRSYNVSQGIPSGVTAQNINMAALTGQPGEVGFQAGQNEIDQIVAQAQALQSGLEIPIQQTAASQEGQGLIDRIVERASAVAPYLKETVGNLFGGQQTEEDKNKITGADYLKAAEGLNFPLIPTVAKNIPVVQQTAVDIFSTIATTLSSVENIKKAASSGIDSLVGQTANLVGTLVEGQATSRQQGEQIAMNINKVKQNIKEIKSKLSQLPPPSRSLMVEQLNKLEELVLDRSARLAGKIFD